MAQNPCPRCGAPRPPSAQGCPRCLLHLGIGSASRPAAPGRAARVAPAPEDLARHFPGLEILERVGQGGMGVVYKARQKKLDRVVALKLLAPELAGDPAFAERFLREARLLARLSHENVVAVHDFGETEGLCWLLMEHVEGVDLRRALDAGGLPPAEALSVVSQMCAALAAAHALGIVHRDIKPENVLLERGGRVKIVDFGLAKLLAQEGEGPHLTAAEQVMGTPHYMAPEQLRGARDVDHRADIYSLGVVFYELLTNELPIGRFEAPSRRVEVDVRLDEIVLRALESEPERRYQSAALVRTDVERVSGKPAPASRDRGPRARRAWAQRPGLVLWIALLLWPPIAGALFGSGLTGVLLALALLVGFAAWGFAVKLRALRPAEAPAQLSRARRIDRDGGALLAGALGAGLLLLALFSAWERGTWDYSPPDRATGWNETAARERLVRVSQLADRVPPALAEPASLAGSFSRELSHQHPAVLGLLGALTLAAAALIALRGRRAGSLRTRAGAVVFAWMLVGGPIVLAATLSSRPLSDRTLASVQGTRWFEADAAQVAGVLEAVLAVEGYSVAARHQELWRAREDLRPLALHARLLLEPTWPPERWRTEAMRVRRAWPALEVLATSDPEGPARTLLDWDAGLLTMSAPEHFEWRAWMEDVLRRVADELSEFSATTPAPR